MLVCENDFNRVVSVYYDELKQYKPISKSKERRLVRLAKNGNLKARNELIECNLRFVFDLAKKYARNGVPISELISEGNLALFKAIDKFDGDKGVKFITYAVWWIKQAMIESIRKNKVRSVYEISDEDNNAVHITLPNMMYDDEDDSSSDGNGSADGYDTDDGSNQVNAVSELLDTLNDKERDIIESYYGINGKKEETLMEIGDKYEISCERVRQVKRNIIRKLRSEVLVKYDTEDLLV